MGEGKPAPKVPTYMEQRKRVIDWCLKNTGDHTIVPQREAKRKSQARQGAGSTGGHLGSYEIKKKKGVIVDQKKRRKRKGY